jgi:hypothetical protein
VDKASNAYNRPREAIIWATENEEGEETTHHLPAVFIVCATCHGRGKAMTRSMREHGYTQEDMDELGQDFQDDYMSGVYDVTCDVCDGARVVLQLDAATAKREMPAVLRAYREHLREEEEYRAICRAERDAGA